MQIMYICLCAYSIRVVSLGKKKKKKKKKKKTELKANT